MHLYLYNHTLYESYWCMIHVSIWILYVEGGGSGDGGGGAIWENMLFTILYILQGRTWSGFFFWWSLTDQLPNYQAI